MSDHKVAVLNLEWASYPCRDRIMATLVCNYLRYQGYSVNEESIFNGYYWINRLRPRVFFITNTIGAKENFEIVKYANGKGLKVISLISEGNFKETKDFVEEFVWGWNKEKIMYEDIHLQWSERTRNLTLKYYPELNSKVRVSGGVGFDIYKILPLPERESFLKKYGKEKYQKIVGIGCYDFSSYYPHDHRFNIVKKVYSSEAEIIRFRRDRDSFREILSRIIPANPDILFLLKKHPGAPADNFAAGIEGLESLDNVLIIQSQEVIFDCLAVSDFWLVYDSTTALEAWLMDKPTGLINPSGTDFLRDNLYLGSPNYSTVEELQKAIDEYYRSGNLVGFAEKEPERRKLIKDIVQWDDGLNHVRAGNEIISLLENNLTGEYKPEPPDYLVKRLRNRLLWIFSPALKFLPKFRFYAERKKNFNRKQLRDFQEKLLKAQIQFYRSRNLSSDKLKKIKCL